MTCQEIHEQITSFVDNRVDEDEYRRKIEQHISYCSSCRAAYELELMTKLAVRQRTRQTSAPEALRASVAAGIDEVEHQQKTGRAKRERRSGSWFDAVAEDLYSPFGVLVALALIVVALIFLVNQGGESDGEQVLQLDEVELPVSESRPPSGPVNLFNFAADNFSAAMNDKLEMTAVDDREELAAVLQEAGEGFDVNPDLVDMDLSSAAVTTVSGTPLAHILYRSDDLVIYRLDTPFQSAVDGSNVYITPDIQERLQSGEWIWEEPYPEIMLTMFKQGETLTTLVSNIPKDDLGKRVGS